MLLLKHMNDLKEWAHEEMQAALSHKTRFLTGGEESSLCKAKLRFYRPTVLLRLRGLFGVIVGMRNSNRITYRTRLSTHLTLSDAVITRLELFCPSCIFVRPTLVTAMCSCAEMYRLSVSARGYGTYVSSRSLPTAVL